jgi:hypothetical protein
MSTTISADEIAYLATMTEQEREMMSALRATRASYEAHLAKKYNLTQGDQIQADGWIVRKADPPPEE